MKIIKDISYSSVQNFTSFIYGFIIHIFLARFLGTEEFGKYSFVIWMVGFLTTFVMLGLPTTMTKYVSQLYPNETYKLRSFIKHYFPQGVGLFILASFLFYIIYKGKMFINYFVVLAITLVCILNGLIISIISGLRNFKVLMYSSLISQSVFLFLILTVVKKIGNIYTAVITYTVYVLVGFLINFFSEKRLFKIFKEKILSQKIDDIVKYYVYVSFAIILDYIVWQNSEIFFLKLYSPINEVSFYTVAFSVAYLPQRLLVSSVSKVILPFMSNIYGKNELDNLNKSYYVFTKYISMILIPIYLILFFIADRVIQLLYGTPYLSSVYPMKIILFSALIGGIASVASNYVHAVEKVDIIVKIGFFVALLNLGLNIVFIPKYHSIGAAIGNSSAQIIGCLLGTFYLVFKFNLKFPWVNIVKYTICSFIVCYILNFLISNQFQNIVHIIIYALFCFFIYIGVIFLDPTERNEFRKMLVKMNKEI